MPPLATFVDRRLRSDVELAYRPILSADGETLSDLPEPLRRWTRSTSCATAWCTRSAAAIEDPALHALVVALAFPSRGSCQSRCVMSYGTVAKHRHRFFAQPEVCTFRIVSERPSLPRGDVHGRHDAGEGTSKDHGRGPVPMCALRHDRSFVPWTVQRSCQRGPLHDVSSTSLRAWTPLDMRPTMRNPTKRNTGWSKAPIRPSWPVVDGRHTFPMHLPPLTSGLGKHPCTCQGSAPHLACAAEATPGAQRHLREVKGFDVVAGDIESDGYGT